MLRLFSDHERNPYELEGIDLPKLIEEYGAKPIADVLEALRWPDGIECPRCQSDRYRASNRAHSTVIMPATNQRHGGHGVP